MQICKHLPGLITCLPSEIRMAGMCWWRLCDGAWVSSESWYRKLQ